MTSTLAPSETLTPMTRCDTLPTVAPAEEVPDVDTAYSEILEEAKEYDPLPRAVIDTITSRIVTRLSSHSEHWARCLGEDPEPFFEEVVTGYTSKGRTTTTSHVSPKASMMCAECPIRPQCAEKALNNLSSHAMSVMAGVRIPYTSKLSRTAQASLLGSIQDHAAMPELIRWYVVLSATSLRYHSGYAADSFSVLRGRMPIGIFKYVCDYLTQYPVSAFTVTTPKMVKTIR